MDQGVENVTTFEMLQELLAQNEFELLLPEDHTANTTEQDIRLVYQMNDTVESFLVFREAIFTGTYKRIMKENWMPLMTGIRTGMCLGCGRETVLLPCFIRS